MLGLNNEKLGTVSATAGAQVGVVAHTPNYIYSSVC